MYTKIPAMTGDQLIELLQKDGWSTVRKTAHGISLYKNIGEFKRLTIIRKGNTPIATGTLAAILARNKQESGKKAC